MNEPKAQTCSAVAVDPRCLCSKSARFIFGAILFIFLVAIFTGSYFFYKKVQLATQQNTELRFKLDELTVSVSNLQQAQLVHRAEQEDIARLHQINDAHVKTGLLLASYQLVTAANLELKATNDIEKAQLLLTDALQRIATIAEFHAIKLALENDITALHGKIFDSEDTVLRLNKLFEQINALEQSSTFIAAPAPIKTSVVTPPPSLTFTVLFEANSWKYLWQNVSYALRHVITISHKEQLPLVLTSVQLVNLKLNIQALLLRASGAVNYHHTKVYVSSLKEVSSLLQTYFAASVETRRDILPLLQQLQRIDVSLKPLNVDKTLRMIEVVLAKK